MNGLERRLPKWWASTVHLNRAQCRHLCVLRCATSVRGPSTRTTGRFEATSSAPQMSLMGRSATVADRDSRHSARSHVNVRPNARLRVRSRQLGSASSFDRI